MVKKRIYSRHSHALHHQHTRKRIHVHHEVFPHTNRQKKILDDLVYAAGLFGPLMTLPQLYTIWVEQNATGVSALTWGAYNITALIWLLYGVAHKEKPIVITNSIWIVVQTLIVIGVMLY